MEKRPAEQAERLRKRIQEGRIELGAMYLNFDELPGERLLASSLSVLEDIRKHGMRVELAMQNDVNGIGWCFGEFFPDAGVKYLNMGTHGHRALICFDKPTVFRWESPSGKTVLAYRAEHYHQGNYFGVHAPEDFARFEKNLLDAVIGLPANLFYGTSIPACILVFKKNRATSDVLFIDASGKDANGNLRYRKDKNQNKLEQSHIDDIFRAYTERVDVERFAHVASFEEIQANEFNLNIPRYVDTFEEEELIDIEEVQGNIERIKAEIAVVEAQMAQYLKELGL